jgi:DNA-binding NtrC family response regulator
MEKILIVDDEKNIRKVITRYLRQEGYFADAVMDYEDAQTRLLDEKYDLILLDLKLPGKSGLELLKWVKKTIPSIPVIMITAYGSIENAVEAIKIGASNYLTKPVDMKDMVAIIRHTLLREQHFIEGEEDSSHMNDEHGIIGRSKKIRDVLSTIDVVASSKANILICGESGTGKELVARAMHKASSRRDGPFIAINCAAVPAELIENELFGHEQGAYTGATTREVGKVELADGGTLFLDEIGDMSLNMQVKLLRFIQEREFFRIGGTRPVMSDCRIIAATNRDLEEDIASGRFREELYYRINVIQIDVPPLRERREDIELLAEHFLRIFAEENKKYVTRISPLALEALSRYDWPGNVRELQNIIERAIVMTRSDIISLEDLPQKISKLHRIEPSEIDELPDMSLSEIEKLAVIKALRAEKWNQTRAAKRLGITRRQLRTKMEKYDLL